MYKALRGLRHEEQPRLEPESQVLAESQAEIRQALRRMEFMKGTYLALVVGARQQLLRTARAELAVRRIPRLE